MYQIAFLKHPECVFCPAIPAVRKAFVCVFGRDAGACKIPTEVRRASPHLCLWLEFNHCTRAVQGHAAGGGRRAAVHHGHPERGREGDSELQHPDQLQQPVQHCHHGRTPGQVGQGG